ncbi:TPA: WxcM-like domain-containing protein [Candidatus Peregrinibacteria bacterium]|nr:WxcM-like domain-containing protein [Candidatus Peregrinibacteria bacterium]HIQ57177.1 FdtA/QdtA family cupin domain-containing protein [Candidatus Gracilibacteria bacterium]
MNNKKSSFYEFEFPQHTDTRGSLVPLEFDENLPFTPKRVYFLHSTPEDMIRGAHSHFIEEEIFMCIAGSCTALIDFDGTGKKEILLDSAQKAIYVGKNVWHEFKNFTPNAILLCLSSVNYLPGESNYELDYEEFQKLN